MLAYVLFTSGRFGCYSVLSLSESAVCVVCAECFGHSCVSGCRCTQISPDLLNQTALHGEKSYHGKYGKKTYSMIYFLVSVWHRL